MLVLDVNKVAKNFGFGSLFDDLSFSLNEGERISIIGPNGGGKSTLLKMIAGIEKCDEGTISIKKNAKVAYLDQTSPDRKDERLVEEVILDAFTDLARIQDEIDNIYKRMETEKNPVEHDRLINRAGVLHEEFQNLGGFNIETDVNIVCSGLDITDEMRMQEYNSLSGGEKTLVHLAKSLLQKPDLFLLDEPTNHLDINRIEWLENYLKSFKGSTVTISHDRRFLDSMSDRMLEIDGEGTVYNTNYSGYLDEKERRYEKIMANWEDQQAYFKRFEDQARRMAQAGMATNSTSMTRKAGVLFARLEREKEKATIKKPEKRRKIKMDFDEQRRAGKRAIEVKCLTVGLHGSDRKIVDNASFYIGTGERVVMIGHNGSGKSSIIKTILGEQDLPHEGVIIVSPSIQIGYLPQIINFEDDKQQLLEYFQKEVSIGEERARAILSRFQFTREDVTKRVGSLSGGERIRVRLASLLQQQINTLIFDEPTNHIDIPTKESLEEALENFDGTLLAISHDRFFIDKFADKIIEVENGRTRTFIGNYTDYIDKVKKEKGLNNLETNRVKDPPGRFQTAKEFK